MNKIILEAETKLEDTELRKLFSKMQTQIDTINQRTKLQTLAIKEIRDILKILEKGGEKCLKV